MGESASLKEDLSILMDMYPELLLDTALQEIEESSSTPMMGSLPFKMSLSVDLLVEYEDQCLPFSQMIDDMISFSVKPSEYPQNINFSIESEWMSEEHISVLCEAIHSEFDRFVDPQSELYDAFTPLLMLIFGFLTEDSAEILFNDGKLKCHSKKIYNKFVRLYDDVECKKFERSNFNCAICMETKKGTKMVKLPCLHYLCSDCTKSYFASMIEGGNIDRVRCPECKYQELDFSTYQDYSKLKKDLFTPAIPFEFFNDILSAELCKRYKDSFHAQKAVRLSKYCMLASIACPRCDYWCIKDDLNETLIQCPNCKFAFCFNCLHSWHGYNNKCGKKLKIADDIIEEYMDALTTDQRKKSLETKYGRKILEHGCGEYIAEKMLDMAIAEEGSDLQRCPQCRLVVQRSEGCNKMKCAVCETLFCYICGSLLNPEDPYEHFREPFSSCYGRLFEGMPGANS
ncbi:hypothetical protein HG535_0E01780 [Zygotorulaspora mrakii]|uniref:RBR-type E3 ubiquitin transferase n=1 Tax=Zygotorulaspora mrakii TaxID=42260 RepID=A0A7H9B3V0_ZYGMR|nr:uncharacterized protein HG535_0E01780 [Zygotorulaspora mrakii]QLG73094.1 hypothetical protein HG535_0E01780 [Zygotorulaspora mrakii]